MKIKTPLKQSVEIYRRKRKGLLNMWESLLDQQKPYANRLGIDQADQERDDHTVLHRNLLKKIRELDEDFATLDLGVWGILLFRPHKRFISKWGTYEPGWPT